MCVLYWVLNVYGWSGMWDLRIRTVGLRNLYGVCVSKDVSYLIILSTQRNLPNHSGLYLPKFSWQRNSLAMCQIFALKTPSIHWDFLQRQQKQRRFWPASAASAQAGAELCMPPHHAIATTTRTRIPASPPVIFFSTSRARAIPCYRLLYLPTT